MNDSISRQAAIDVICKACSMEEDYHKCNGYPETSTWCNYLVALRALPSTQPTLYGYKIEHLAYIAKVMEKEGVTAEYAVKTFDDISRALRMIIEETQEKVMEALNERYDLQTGGD